MFKKQTRTGGKEFKPGIKSTTVYAVNAQIFCLQLSGCKVKLIPHHQSLGRGGFLRFGVLGCGVLDQLWVSRPFGDVATNRRCRDQLEVSGEEVFKRLVSILGRI